jgi:hypothetical protein
VTPTQFESFPLYAIQTILIAAVMYLLVWRQPLILRLQVLGWVAGVLAIAWRNGPIAQLGFYSNDQLHYASVIRILVSETWPHDSSWWLEYSKIPYPMAAYPLALIGIHWALALKTVSLVCLLALSRAVIDRHAEAGFTSQFKVLYLTNCGLIGPFFSLLALRETMMMYLVYRYTTDRSVIARLVSFGILFLLRSHLATALIVAELVLAAWRWFTGHRRTGFVEVPVLIVGGVTLGTVLFSIRFAGIDEVRTPFTGDFGRSELIQIASNFAGLQFATSHEAFVRLSVSELLLLRIIFSDTILTPLVFTVVCFVFGNKLSERHRFVLLVFCIYVTIVTNTDFNSFRQNIPLMPLLGLVILDIIGERRRRAGIDYRRERAPALLVN